MAGMDLPQYLGQKEAAEKEVIEIEEAKK